MEKIRQRAREIEAKKQADKAAKRRRLEEEEEKADNAVQDYDVEEVQEVQEAQEEVQEVSLDFAALFTQLHNSPNLLPLPSSTSLNTCCESLLINALVESALGHILYSLAMIPLPLSALLLQANEWTSVDKLHLTQKKALAFVNSLQKILADLDSCLQSLLALHRQGGGGGCAVRKVVFALGPSISNVKRSYVINFPVIVDASAQEVMKRCVSSPSKERFVDRVRRLTTQQFVNYFAEIAENIASPAVTALSRGNIFIAVQTSISSEQQSVQTNPGFDNFLNSISASSFHLLPTFQIKKRQRRSPDPLQTIVSLSTQDVIGTETDQNFFWLVQKRGLKALKK